MPSNDIDQRAIKNVHCPFCAAAPGEQCRVPASWNVGREGHPYTHTPRRAAYRRFRDGNNKQILGEENT